jgi:N-acetylneuraminic acid mutarotase
MNRNRDDVVVKVLNGKIYAIGGNNGTGAVKSMESYDPIKNEWTLLPSMCNPRYGHAVV